MRKCIVSSIILLFLIQLGCVTFPTSRYFAPPDTVENVVNHIVSIAVYYYMPQEEYNRRLMETSVAHRVPIRAYDSKGRPVPCLAYIGSGTLGLKNHVITVRHLFNHDNNTYRRDIWVLKSGVDHAVSAELVAISDGASDADDYAVIKLKEDLGLPGLRIAKDEPKRGEKVMFGCSVGGSAFFLRFAWLSKYHKFFTRDDEGQLHLSKWNEFAFNTVHPGGKGDSGSGIFNINGELIGIVYCGVNLYDSYCFANPISMLHDFLEANNLAWLAQ